MSTSYYSYVGPMIRIPKKNIDIQQRACINEHCYKHGKLTELNSNYCSLCGDPIGIAIVSVPVINPNEWFMSWQKIPGIERHIAGVALSENMTLDELYIAFEDYFETVDYHIIHSTYNYKISDDDGIECNKLTPQSLSEMCDAFKNDDLVKLFIKVLSLALQEKIEVFCGHKLYISV